MVASKLRYFRAIYTYITSLGVIISLKARQSRTTQAMEGQPAAAIFAALRPHAAMAQCPAFAAGLAVDITTVKSVTASLIYLYCCYAAYFGAAALPLHAMILSSFLSFTLYFIRRLPPPVLRAHDAKKLAAAAVYMMIYGWLGEDGGGRYHISLRPCNRRQQV